MNKYNRNNFHKYTFCEFTEVDSMTVSELKWDYKSKSGSGYCFTKEGVYRISNHWGRAANCRWRLISNTNLNSSSKVNNSQNRIGYANWTDFYPSNETENLFYIEVNFEIKNVTFQHKFNPNYDGKAVLRNASETAKVIRQIKEILESETWAKYLNFDDLEQLRKEIILQLITTNTSLQILKKELLK